MSSSFDVDLSKTKEKLSTENTFVQEKSKSRSFSS